MQPSAPMDPKTPHQPHDKLLRKILAQRKNARSFFENNLPRELPPLLQWGTLRRIPGSFIDNRLKGSESDLLFSVTLRDSPVLLSLLFEHQSTEDPRIALRLLGYVVRIWERFASHKPASKKLPPVFPLVLAQGERPWRTSTQLADLVDIPPGMESVWGPWQPTLRYQVMDLHALPYTALTGSAETTLALRLLKAAREGDLLADWIWDESLLEAISPDARELWMR